MLRRFVCWMYGEPLPPAEVRLKSIVDDVTTPDAIIAARIVDSIAREFEDWRVLPRKPGDNYEIPMEVASVQSQYDEPSAKRTRLFHKKRQLEVVCDVTWNKRPASSWYDPVLTVEVNEVVIAKPHSSHIWISWKKMATIDEATKAAAAKALASQQLNEKKWNLAEQAFGIKRDKLGRIIFEQYEDVPCECGAPVKCEGECEAPTRAKSGKGA